MEQKKAIVTAVQANGTWNSNYGLMYKFEITFDNGDHGEYNSVKAEQDKFVTGVEAEYLKTSREYNGTTYYTIKPFSNFNAGNSTGGGFKGKDPKTSRHILRMNVLQRAVDLAIADKIPLKDIPAIAEKFATWVQIETGSSDQPAKTLPSSPPPAPMQTNDLPF